MRFRSIWRKPQYVVRATFKTQIAPGQTTIHPGLHANFHDEGGQGGYLDTEAEQRTLGWSEEEREQVEQHLLNHSDFGRGIYLAESAEMRPEDLEPEGCIFTAPDGSVAERCGKARAEDSAYCEEHQELVTTAMALAGEAE